jgi:hypothetical protein
VGNIKFLIRVTFVLSGTGLKGIIWAKHASRMEEMRILDEYLVKNL